MSPNFWLSARSSAALSAFAGSCVLPSSAMMLFLIERISASPASSCCWTPASWVVSALTWSVSAFSAAAARSFMAATLSLIPFTAGSMLLALGIALEHGEVLLHGIGILGLLLQRRGLARGGRGRLGLVGLRLLRGQRRCRRCRCWTGSPRAARRSRAGRPGRRGRPGASRGIGPAANAVSARVKPARRASCRAVSASRALVVKYA